MPKYSSEDLRKISGNQLSYKHYSRSVAAFNGLREMFGKDWVETETVVQFLTDDIVIQALGNDRVYGGISDVEKLVFLWEDIQLIQNLKGFDKLCKKLKRKLRFENVDLEVSIAAELMRCNASIELEPTIGDGEKKADCKFKTAESEPWVYVEISRKQVADTQRTIKVRGAELAELVSLINPLRRCILVLIKEVKEDQFLRIIDWLKTSPCEGKFEDAAIFFTVAHNEDESRIALQYVTPPVSVRQGSGNMLGGAWGVVYLHIPDYGAKNKLEEKIPKQLPKNQQGILIVDLSIVAGGFVDWEKQIKFEVQTEHCGAVLLLRDGLTSSGFIREIKIIPNLNSKNVLSNATNVFLEKFSRVHGSKNLVGA
jgi:hypothetical protein